MAKIPVTVYTKSNCVQCEMTKKQLTKKNIHFEEVDLEKSPKKLEEFKSRGLMAAPIVTTDVKEWSGFKPAKIESLANYLFGNDHKDVK
jgi:glutaredoxin-like protein NrdH